MSRFFNKFFIFINSWTGAIILVILFVVFVAQNFSIPSASMQNTMLIGDYLLVKKYSYGVTIPKMPFFGFSILPDFNDNGHLIEGDRPKRGDIVVFYSPQNPKIHFVKRNVAIGGDKVLYTKEGLFLHFSEGNAKMQEDFKDAEFLEFNGDLYVFDPYFKIHPGVKYESKEPGNHHLSSFTQMQHDSTLAMKPIRLANGEMAFYYEVPMDTFFMMGDNRDNSNDSRFWGSVGYPFIVGKPWFVYFSWDENYEIRWDRVGKSFETLEKEMHSRQELVQIH